MPTCKCNQRSKIEATYLDCGDRLVLIDNDKVELQVDSVEYDEVYLHLAVEPSSHNGTLWLSAAQARDLAKRLKKAAKETLVSYE